ncbi:hypothetical protein MPSEU_000147500 [Mayamaea pseudoterrestris]|nr:hypothetical protein MPSEU_000147500 [Mayamaea pseudoterrestris]
MLRIAILLLGAQTSQCFVLKSSAPSSSSMFMSSPPPKSGKQYFKKKPTKHITLGELQNELKQNPQQFQKAADAKNKKKTSRRTRRKVDQPKQTYLYKAQRDRQRIMEHGSSHDAMEAKATAAATPIISDSVRLAAQLGLKATAQHCDAPVDSAMQPIVLGRIRVKDGDSSGSFAYVLEKPPGWAILGGKESSAAASTTNDASKDAAPAAKPLDRNKFRRQVKAKNDDGSIEVMEYNELDILALLTPEEREEYLEQHDDLKELKGHQHISVVASPIAEEHVSESSETTKDEHHLEVESSSRELAPETLQNLNRIAARAASNAGTATFAKHAARRPSLVSWFKEHKLEQDGTIIRGGNFWVALAGATEVDDSGAVFLCPRSAVNERGICVEAIEYVAVVGNGGHVQTSVLADKSYDGLAVEVIGKIRMGRADDVIQAAKIMVPEVVSTCSHVVGICQQQFREGVRGDVVASPLDRRAWRRLIHCSKISISSLDYDEDLTVETTRLPDDIVPVINRRPNQKFIAGSWLGRTDLRENPLTSAYREINGAADGYPGWTVDRYGRWLLVQHDPAYPRGPLPSIHDGYTAGVYYLEASQDRTAMGSAEVRPILLEGQSAPDWLLPIKENGVTYLACLDKDLSTGIFLDQRPNRAWLARNCCADTKVLNCFAHSGAFSVAAATAGASTVSIDLSKKWLDRLPAQFEANGIAFDHSHDCIYGDCFDWLAKLAKRGEKYDVVILDPPSTSVSGISKKRWSVASDMDALVALAAPLVKRGGLLWTTTNSGKISASRFARSCKRGLDEAGCEAKLERLQSMPNDFPSVGAQPVKNLVWRIVSTDTK